MVALAAPIAGYAAEKITLENKFYSSNGIHAYYGTTDSGRRVIYATNRRVHGKTVEVPNVTVARLNNYWDTNHPVTEPVTIRHEQAEPQPAQPQLRNGVPVCYWHGIYVTPSRVGNQLVCPSENSPYSTVQ